MTGNLHKPARASGMLATQTHANDIHLGSRHLTLVVTDFEKFLER